MLNPLSGAAAVPVSAAPKAVQAPTGDVEFSYNPQDQVVMAPETTVVKGVKASPSGPSTERVVLSGTSLPPTKDGNYVYPQSDKNYHASTTLATVAKTVEVMEKAYGSKIPWAFGDEQIKLLPDAGEDFNAYYAREESSLNFFHGNDPKTRKMVYSGDSGEVVSHEVGHALLDGVRPDYLEAFGLETGSFHEAFGDVVGFLMAVQDDKTVAMVAKETGGDLSKPNSLAYTGEELGTAINDSVGRNVTGGPYVRNAINSFKWQDPKTLPKGGGPDKLYNEVHSWSRLWTGAFYDVFKGMVANHMQAGMGAEQAIKAAGNDSLEMYGHLLREAPRGECTYQQLAQALLKVDANEMGGKNQKLLRQVYTDRKILPQNLAMSTEPQVARDPSAPPVRPLSVTLSGSEFGMFSGAKVTTMVDGSNPLAKDADAQIRLKDTLKDLIANGRILYTEPHQKLGTRDYFDKNGQPYTGVVRWVDGQMTIARVPILA